MSPSVMRDLDEVGCLALPALDGVREARVEVGGLALDDLDVLHRSAGLRELDGRHEDDEFVVLLADLRDERVLEAGAVDGRESARMLKELVELPEPRVRDRGDDERHGGEADAAHLVGDAEDVAEGGVRAELDEAPDIDIGALQE